MSKCSPLPPPRLCFFDDNGKPLHLGKLYVYRAGTSTLKPCWTDSTGTTQHVQPIILQYGQADVWIGDGAEAYRFVLFDANDNLIWEEDGIYTQAGAPGTVGGEPGPTGGVGPPGPPGIVGPRGKTGATGDPGADATAGNGAIVFKTAGTYTGTVPTGVNKVYLSGAGAGGGGFAGAVGPTAVPYAGNGGGGGGHGALAWFNELNVSAGDTYEVTIGAGGTGGIPGGSNPTAGADTVLKINNTEVLRLTGGQPGVPATGVVCPVGGWPGGVGTYTVWARSTPTTEPQHIQSMPGTGGDGATGPFGVGGGGGNCGIAPDVPVSWYYLLDMKGGDGQDGKGNGTGGGGGGGGATYVYGSGTSVGAKPTTAPAEPQGQVTAAALNPKGGDAGKGGAGAPGILVVNYLQNI